MYVSKIFGLSNQNNLRIQQNNVRNKRNVSFQSNYAATFHEGVIKNFTRLDPDVLSFCKDLIQQIKSMPNVNISPLLSRINSYSSESLPSLMRILCTKEEDILAKDIYGKELMVSTKVDDYKNVTFFEPSGNRYLSIEENDSSYEFTKGTTDEYGTTEFYKFYDFDESPSGWLKSYTLASGSGYGATSNTTYYNKDGSVREGRTLFDRLFGL